MFLFNVFFSFSYTVIKKLKEIFIMAMGTGYLRVQVTANDSVLPIVGAEVTVTQRDGATLFKTRTGEDGKTEDFALPAPCFQNTLIQYTAAPTSSLCDINVSSQGFVTQHVRGVEILDGQTAILPVHMEPLVDEPNPKRDEIIDISPNGQSYPPSCPIRDASPARSRNEVTIPDYITVHLGRPENTAARSVRVNFVDYIKNVTSSEIYATWPEQSLKANIHAIVSFALNRVYT